MNRTFYYYGRLFLGLGAATGLLHSIVYFMVGPKILGLNSVIVWIAVLTLVTLAGSGILLKYYHYKHYRLPLFSGALVLISSVITTITVVAVLIARSWQDLHIASLIGTTVAGLVYGASLVFSPSGKQPWLRAAGLVIVVTGMLIGGAIMLALRTPTQINDTAVMIEQWTTLARAFIPLMFLMQFLREERLLGPEASRPSSKQNEGILAPMGLIAFLVTIMASILIARDAIGAVVWGRVNAARAQAIVDRSESRTFVGKDGDTLRFLLMKPLDYDPARKYPLVVCLPYGHYESPPAVFLSDDENRKKYPAFLFIPYSREGTSWGGIPGWPATDEVVFECLNALREPGIDVKRRYVSGVSKGGYGSWHFITEHPEMFAAAIPVCGGGDPSRAGEITGVPVWAFHGAQDHNAPVSGSRDMIDAIRKAGGDPKYTEYGHLGHNIWNEVSKTPGLLDWLFSQRKE